MVKKSSNPISNQGSYTSYNPYKGGYSLIPNSLNQRVRRYTITEAFETVPLVFSCCDMIGSAISSVPMYFYTYTSKGRKLLNDMKITRDSIEYKNIKTDTGITQGVSSEWLIERTKTMKEYEKEGIVTKITQNHPLYKLLNPPLPNIIQSFSNLIYLTLVTSLNFGEYFWLFEYKGKTPINIHPETGLNMVPRVTESGPNETLVGWNQKVTTSSGKQYEVTWDVEDLLQHKLPNILNKYRGLPPLKAGRLTIEQFLNIAIWNAGLFKEGVRPPIVIETDQAIAGAQYKEWIANIVTKFSGFLRGHHPLTLTRGAKAKVLFNEREVDFLKSLELTKEEICSLLHIPPAMVGIFRWANYANAKIQKEVFWELGNIPRMIWLQENIQSGLLDPFFPDIFAEWDYEFIKALREDPGEDAETKKSIAQSAEIYWGMGYDQDQIAEILGEPLLAGNTLKKPDETDSVDVELSAFTKSVDTETSDMVYKASEGFYEAYSRNYIKYVLEPNTNNLIKYYKRFVNEISDNLVNQVKRGGLVAPINSLEWSLEWEKISHGIVEKVFYKGIDTVKEEVMRPEKVLHTLTQYSKNTDLSIFFDEEQEKELQNLLIDVNKRSVFVQEIINKLNNITIALRGIESDDELLTILEQTRKELLSNVSNAQARSIVGFVYNAGRQIGMSRFNVKKHIWVASNNVKREAHRKAHEKEALVGSPFKYTGIRFPYDPEGLLPNTTNCQCCTIVSVVKSDNGIVHLLN